MPGDVHMVEEAVTVLFHDVKPEPCTQSRLPAQDMFQNARECIGR